MADSPVLYQGVRSGASPFTYSDEDTATNRIRYELDSNGRTLTDEKTSRSQILAWEIARPGTPRPAEIIFGEPLSAITSIRTFGDENTVEEPQISGDISQGDNRRIFKQQVGAMPEGLIINGYVLVGGASILDGMRRLYIDEQVSVEFPFGNIGFYSNVIPYFNIKPNAERGYTMKPPIITWNAPNAKADFEMTLMFGGEYP